MTGIGDNRVMRVFVFGAGASVHAGYPLAKALGRTLVEWADRVTKKSVWWVSSRELEGMPGFPDDFEELISHLEAQSTTEAADLRGRLKSTLSGFFRSIQDHTAPLYCDFSTLVTPGDVVITFNYDAAVERELKVADLWEIGNGYGFEVDCQLPRSRTLVLKLHGSANWLDLVFDGLRGFACFDPSEGSLGTRPVFVDPDLAYLGYPVLRDPRLRNGPQERGAVGPSIILPGRNKQFYYSTSVNDREREAFWDDLWNQAGLALHEASEIVLIGYSMPLADSRARELLLQCGNRKAETWICSRGESNRIAGEFQKAGFERVRTDAKDFERWLRYAAR